MPQVAINILTKNRLELLKRALASVRAQTFTDYQIIIVNDGSEDGTKEFLNTLPKKNLEVTNLYESCGISYCRQYALLSSYAMYVAILDDDDEWLDPNKLKKQVEYLESHPEVVLVGGGIKSDREQFRPETDEQIRKTMLFRNNFFTSTVMFKKRAASDAGWFVKDADDLAEDYDLWLRLGKIGKMYNFQEVFTAYTAPTYDKQKFRKFLAKQLRLAGQHRADYPYYILSALILKLRLFFGI